MEVTYEAGQERRHKRFRLDLMEINHKMILAHKVEIIDISLGGVALKTDRRLNVCKEYLIKLGDKGKSIDVKGITVRLRINQNERKKQRREGLDIHGRYDV